MRNQLADIKMTKFLKSKMNINYAETTSADFMKKLEEERKAKYNMAYDYGRWLALM